MEAEGPPRGHTACPWHNQSQSQDGRSLPSLLCPAPLSVTLRGGASRCFGHFDFSYFSGCADSQSPLAEGNLISCEKVQTWGSDTQPFKGRLHHCWLRDPTPRARLMIGALGQHLAPEGQGAQVIPGRNHPDTRAQEQCVRGEPEDPATPTTGISFFLL